MRIKRLLVWIIGITLTLPATAQDYMLEIGANAGVGYYMGDLNELSFYHKVRESYGALFRYNHNFRSAIKLTFTTGRLSGETNPSGNRFPEPLAGSSFTTQIYDLAAMYEFNFFHYSDGYAYLGTKRLTPYITAGLGATVASGTGGTVVAPIIPFGVGLKYKLKQRINIGCEISFRWALSDKIDGTAWKDPYRIESNGLKNNDWYSFTHFFISYSFHQRRKVCNSLID